MDNSFKDTFTSERELFKAMVIKTSFITSVISLEQQKGAKLSSNEIEEIYKRAFALHDTFSDCVNNHVSKHKDHKDHNSFSDC